MTSRTGRAPRLNKPGSELIRVLTRPHRLTFQAPRPTGVSGPTGWKTRWGISLAAFHRDASRLTQTDGSWTSTNTSLLSFAINKMPGGVIYMKKKLTLLCFPGTRTKYEKQQSKRKSKKPDLGQFLCCIYCYKFLIVIRFWLIAVTINSK